jgi:hypothetical protein
MIEGEKTEEKRESTESLPSLEKAGNAPQMPWFVAILPRWAIRCLQQRR